MSDTTLDDFKKFLGSTDKPVLVMFSSSWCSPCKQLKPIFIEASKSTTKAVFVGVDIEDGHEIASEYKVSRIPIIKVFSKGVEIDSMSGSNDTMFKKLVSKHTSN